VGFPHAAQAIYVRSVCVRKRDGLTSTNTHYYLCSSSAAQISAKRLAQTIRSHWMIENGNHYRRDATWDEDACRCRRGRTAANLALLRGALLAGILRDGSVNLRELSARFAARPHRALKLLFALPSRPKNQLTGHS